MSHHRSKRKSAAGSAVRQRSTLIITCILCFVVLCALIIWCVIAAGSNQGAEQPSGGAAPTAPIRIEEVEEVGISLGHGLEIADVAKYSGIYMEDGSDEIVTGLFMIVVTNTGTDDIQYAAIEMAVGDVTAQFTLTTLPAGESMVLLEKNRMAYSGAADITTATAKNVAVFSHPLSTCEDKLQIQALNGALNVTNISGEDITGDVVIYYKNSSSDMLYGGITYRVSIPGGIAAGELKQITAGHFTTSGSRIMFVTCG